MSLKQERKLQPELILRIFGVAFFAYLFFVSVFKGYIY